MIIDVGLNLRNIVKPFCFIGSNVKFIPIFFKVIQTISGYEDLIIREHNTIIAPDFV